MRHMSSADGLLPLIIGITGHRNPDPSGVSALELEIERMLRVLDEAAPHTPFVLLTPLATGCDRVAARVALRFKRALPGQRIEVVGVFPFAINDYRQDFLGDARDAGEFEELLSKVDSWFELPRWEHAEVDERGFVSHPEHRDLHYRRLGLFVALQSQVMIAMWDGVRNNKVGGTAEVVDFCDGKRPRELNCGVPFRSRLMLLAPPDRTPVCCIPTRREGAPPPQPESISRASEGVPRRTIDDLCDLDALNVRLARTPAPGWHSSVFDVPVSTAVARRWASAQARFERLDSLASQSKKAYLMGAKSVAVLGALGIASFQWFSSFAEGYPRHAWIALALYAAFLLAAAALWWFHARHRRTEWMFVHARALAEALRVQIAWTGSGISEVAPDLYFARRHAEVRFLREQLRAATLDCVIVAAGGGTGAGNSIGVNWIAEQSAYFRFDGRQMSPRVRSERWQNACARALKAAVFCLSLLLAAFATWEAVGAKGTVEATAGYGCFIVGVALATVVAFNYWREVVLDGEDLEAASRMHGVYERASELLRPDSSHSNEVLRAMGKEALDEHAEWFARHRDRLRLPDAG
jgi:hypothetical protein